MAIEGANRLIAAVADAHSLEARAKILRPLFDGTLAVRRPGASCALDGNLTTRLGEIATRRHCAGGSARWPRQPRQPSLGDDHPRATLYVNLEAGIPPIGVFR